MENVHKGKLSQPIAKKIIEEVSKIIDYDIDIMNVKGEVVASTDKERIDTFHEGAFKVIDEKLDQLVIHQEDQYEGCGKGVILPIYNEETVIGAIGIPGEADEIISYAKVIKKMTEITVTNIFQIYVSSFFEQEKLLFFNDLLNGRNLDDKQYIEQNLTRYKLSPDKPFFIATIYPAKGDLFLNIRGITSVNIPNTTVLICNANNSSVYRDMVHFSLHESGFENHLCAIGGIQSSYEDIPLSYAQSKKVLQLREHMERGIFFYEDELQELVFREVPSPLREEYRAKVFSGVHDSDLKDIMNFIDAYCTNNGSVTKIADQLFIHKNTVQYKINRIKQLTGKDLKIIGDMIELYLAVKI